MLLATYLALISKHICSKNHVPFVKRKMNEHSIFSINYLPVQHLNRKRNSFWMISKHTISYRTAVFQYPVSMIMLNIRQPLKA